MRIIEAKLSLLNDDPKMPNLQIKGDKKWLITFAAMLVKSMAEYSNSDIKETIWLIEQEIVQLEIIDGT